MKEEMKKKTTNELLEEKSKKLDIILDESEVLTCPYCGQTYKDIHACGGSGMGGSGICCKNNYIKEKIINELLKEQLKKKLLILLNGISIGMSITVIVFHLLK